MENWNATAHKLLDAAEQLIKLRGFNAFSFRDLQQKVGVKTSTIHYYFSTKTDLADAAAERFLENHKQALKSLAANQPSAIERLQSVVRFFVSNSKNGEFCLGGMLTSDLQALSTNATKILSAFFRHFEKWIEDTLNHGKTIGEIDTQVDAKQFARVFVASLEGGMLISRVTRSSTYYKTLLGQLINQIKIKEIPNE